MKEWVPHFRDMLDFAERARAMAKASGNEEIRKLALERALELMGEAAKRIPRDLQPEWPDIPWKDMIDLRNVLSHEYEVLSLHKLENVAIVDVPPIIEAIQKILAEHAE